MRYFSKGKKSTATLKYLQKQWSDEFSRKAREHSYRARSAYKLLEINEKYKIIQPGKFDLKHYFDNWELRKVWWLKKKGGNERRKRKAIMYNKKKKSKE